MKSRLSTLRAKEDSNWTVIRINSSSIFLTSPIIFTNHKSLVLDGQGASIICTNREAAQLVFLTSRILP